MLPIDPRLLQRIGPARRYVTVTVLLGLVTAVLVIVQALLLARILAPSLSPSPLFPLTPGADGLGWWGSVVPVAARDLRTGITALAIVVIGRAAVAWAQERLAHRAGARVISELREQVVEHVAGFGPRWVASGAGADVTTLTTRGLDALLPYFVRYLPQLALAATVTPLALTVVLGLDWLSALIAALALPLVPLFMVLIGKLTQERSRRHLEAMQRLGTRTLDLIAGLPTLRGLGRASGPAARVRELGEAHRASTMASLRVAFLSGMVLELLTTLAVALVAVTMGFRLIAGDVGIEMALAVLVLAPEIFLPLRHVGTHFHASSDGLAAANAAFAVLDQPLPGVDRSLGEAPALAGLPLRVSGLTVATPDGTRFAPGFLTFEALPGSVTALEGPNGDGKSTALMVAAGLLVADAGEVWAGEHPLDDGGQRVDSAGWAGQVAWVPQRPDLGIAGQTMSLGERQQVAIERALDSRRPWMLLDEPTAHLDGVSADAVIALIREAAARGATVVVATHDPAVLAAADRRVTVRATEAAT